MRISPLGSLSRSYCRIIGFLVRELVLHSGKSCGISIFGTSSGNVTAQLVFWELTEGVDVKVTDQSFTKEWFITSS